MSQFFGQDQFGRYPSQMPQRGYADNRNFGGGQQGGGFGGGFGFNNPYQKRRLNSSGFFGGAGGRYLNSNQESNYFGGGNQYLPPRMPYPMPSPYPGGGNFGPIRGGGMGQVTPTNMPFRDPGYGSPVRTQNLISAMSGPQDLMSDRRMGSLNMLDQLRNRTESPSLLGPNRYGSESNNYQNRLGDGRYNPIRTADFQDRNRNGVDDRDEGGGGIGGFFGGGYGSGMGGRSDGLSGPGTPANPYEPPPRLNETPYGVDEIGNALTKESYDYILNNSGVDSDGDGKINSEEFDAYSDTEDAKNYMPGELPEQLRRIVAPDDTMYGTRYDGKAFTDANFGRFTDANKDGVGSADRDSDKRISEDEWLDWMLSKGATEGYEKDWTTKIRGALSSGMESGSIDSTTKQAAIRALLETEKGNYKPDYNIQTGETEQEIKDRWKREEAEKAGGGEEQSANNGGGGSPPANNGGSPPANNGGASAPINEDARAAMIAAGIDPAMMENILAGNFNFGFSGGGKTQSSMENLIAMATGGGNSGGMGSYRGGEGLERLMRNLQARKLQERR